MRTRSHPVKTMEAGDFVLYDDQGRDTDLGDVPSFNRPMFQSYRGAAADTSPLLEEAPVAQMAGPTLSSQSTPMLPRKSPLQRNNLSPTNTPPQPSSGTLGAPLHLLSLQGATDSDASSTPKLTPLFPNISTESNTNTSASSSPNHVLTPPSQPPADQRPWIMPTNDGNSLSFMWKPNDQSAENMQRWKSYWNANGGPRSNQPLSTNLDLAQNQNQVSAGFFPMPADKMTVSPRDLHLDYDEATTPPAKYKDVNLFGDSAPLFPPAPSNDESGAQPSLSQLPMSMETGSSTEEEDDEDEKPFQGGPHTQTNMGQTVPNEQLLEQWSRPMYGGAPRNIPIPSHPHHQDSMSYSQFGPAFSSVSTSSESEDEAGDRTTTKPSTKGTHSGGQPFQRSASGTLGGYGYIPRSQDSTMSTSTESESAPDSRMSMSMTESGYTSREESQPRSPTILDSAQAIEPKTESPPSTLSSTAPPVPTAGRPRRSSSRTRRTNDAHVIPTSAAVGSTSSDSSSPEADGDSDYEQSHHIVHPTPRASRRGRPPRSVAGAHRRTGSANSLHNTVGHPFGTSPTNLQGMTRPNTTSPVAAGSAIRCDYISPITHQVCGTVFHRMYDLARHRITLHLREEAQMVKDGVLKVDQCLVLGKEVDVDKALAELEWNCRVCGATFSRKDAMLRHERLRHHR